MSITFNSKKPAELFFGNKSVAAVYRGNKLVWEKLVKQLESAFLRDQCFEFIPTEDIVLTDVEFFSPNNSSDTRAKLRILNEAGICVVYRDENGVQLNVTVYNLTGSLKTFTSLGTVTLFKDNVYYINIKGPYSGEGDGSGMTGAIYTGYTGRYKHWTGIANVNGVYSSDAWNHKCYGSAETFAEICQKGLGYFIWKGTQMSNGMVPSDSGVGNPYPYLLKRDMSRVKHVFTDSEFSNVPIGNYNDDVARYAYLFYIAGNTPGDEFIMNTNYWDRGFNIDPSDQSYVAFDNNRQKIFTLSENMVRNHITSMTPMDSPPDNPENWGIYYKSNAQTWGNISQRAVVAWNNNQWEIAKGYNVEFTADSTYNATNYAEKINDNYAKDFNNVSVTSGDKLYFRLNGNEVF